MGHVINYEDLDFATCIKYYEIYRSLSEDKWIDFWTSKTCGRVWRLMWFTTYQNQESQHNENEWAM